MKPLLPYLFPRTMLMVLITLPPAFSLAGPNPVRLSYFELRYWDEHTPRESYQTAPGSYVLSTPTLFGPFELWSVTTEDSANGTRSTVSVTGRGCHPDQPAPAILYSIGDIVPQLGAQSIFGEVYTVTTNATDTSSPSIIQFSPLFGNAGGIPAIQLNSYLESLEQTDVNQLASALSGQVIHVHLPMINFPESGTTIYPLFTVQDVIAQDDGIIISANPLTCHPLSQCPLPGTGTAPVSGASVSVLTQPDEHGYTVQIRLSRKLVIQQVEITNNRLNRTLKIHLMDRLPSPQIRRRTCEPFKLPDGQLAWPERLS